MFKYIKYLPIILLTTIFCSCGDDNEGDEPLAPTTNAEYYVKYEASVSSLHSGNVNYSVNTDDGELSFISGKSFSQTFGPVSKGFNASITVNASGLYHANCDVNIYVCRGSEPFALKAHDLGVNTTTVSYTIDY